MKIGKCRGLHAMCPQRRPLQIGLNLEMCNRAFDGAFPAKKKCARDDCRGTLPILLFPNSHAYAHNVKSRNAPLPPCLNGLVDKGLGESQDCALVERDCLNLAPMGASRDPLNSFHAGSAAQNVLIQWVPAFAGMTGCGRAREAH